MATGAWDGQGKRIDADVQDAAAKALGADLPGSVAPVRSEIDSESLLILAAHQFTAEYANQAIAFFDRYVP